MTSPAIPTSETRYRQAVIKAEAGDHEGGYTLGAFNRSEHEAVQATMNNSSIDYHQSGHLEYRRGRGMRKCEERDCLLCLDLGLNDGKWRENKNERDLFRQ